jgi:hypothetical protein
MRHIVSVAIALVASVSFAAPASRPEQPLSGGFEVQDLPATLVPGGPATASPRPPEPLISDPEPDPASFRHELPKPEPVLPDPEPEPEPEKPKAPEMPAPDPLRGDVDALREKVERLTERLARLESDHAKFFAGPPPPAKSPPAAVAPVAAPRPVQYVQPNPPAIVPTYQAPVYQPPAAWSYPVQGAACGPGGCGQPSGGFAPFGMRFFRR